MSRPTWADIQRMLAERPRLFEDPESAPKLAAAELYVWSRQAWNAAIAMRGPAAVEIQPLDHDELWLFDGFSILTPPLVPETHQLVSGLFRQWSPGEVTLDLIAFRDRTGDTPPRVVATGIEPVGTPAPRGTLAYNIEMAALWRWTPAALIGRRAPGTHAQRRRGDQREPSSTHVVTLRPLPSTPHDGAGGSVEWSCRWHVRPYVRVQAGRPIAVSGHVKGPQGKPFAATVYRVAR